MPLNPSVLIIGKLTVGMMWIVTGATLFLPGDSLLLEAGRLTFGITAAAHVIECAIFFPTLRDATHRSLAENLVLTLIFGVFQYATVKYEAFVDEGGVTEGPGASPAFDPERER